MYIMGDLNCNLLSTDCRESKSLTSFYESFNLWQLIAAPTRVTESSRSLLDVILASQTKQVVKAGVMDSSSSDHDMVFAVFAVGSTVVQFSSCFSSIFTFFKFS